MLRCACKYLKISAGNILDLDIYEGIFASLDERHGAYGIINCITIKKTFRIMKEAKHEQMRQNEVTLEKILDAMELSGKWVVKRLNGNPTSGPFSELVLTEKAAVFFPKVAYMKWASGAWKWKQGLDLTTQFIRIIRSEMSHRLRDWRERNEPEPMNNELVARELEQALADELEMEEEMKDLGYANILEYVSEHPRLVVYVNLVRETNDYRTISKKLRITMTEVKEQEAEVIKIVRTNRAK